MSVLVINPGGRTLHYGLCSAADGVLASARIQDYRHQDKTEILKQIQRALDPKNPKIVAIRVSFGGDDFTGPTLMDDDSLATLRRLIPQAPFHLPTVLKLASASQALFSGAPVVFLFETAFFSGLPGRERVYAVPPEISGARVQRHGFHGLMHEAACRQAALGLRRRRLGRPAKILSLCLEPRPEAAAAIDLRPVMATGGATPLEGLPGDTSCGDLDTGIIITLGRELAWGPEQINLVLTSESGISGMLGRPATLGGIFASEQKDCRLARHFMNYRFLQVCGAAAAAMEGLDCVIFSGQYRAAGRTIGPWLLSQLEFLSRNPGEPRLHWEIMDQPLEKIMAEGAEVYMRGKAIPAAVP